MSLTRQLDQITLTENLSWKFLVFRKKYSFPIFRILHFRSLPSQLSLVHISSNTNVQVVIGTSTMNNQIVIQS